MTSSKMSSEQDELEPPVKKERLDEEFCRATTEEMLDYEIPMQIDVPDAAGAEVDPLMPVENEQELAEIPQQSSSLDIVHPIKSEPEVKTEVVDRSNEVGSSLPKIGSVISNFMMPKDQIFESAVIENSELSGKSDDDLNPVLKEEVDVSTDKKSDVQEIRIGPKSVQAPGESSDAVDCDVQPVDEIRQLNSFWQANKEQRSSALLSVLMKPQDSNASGQVQVAGPAVDGVQQTINQAIQKAQLFKNAQQGPGHDMSNSANRFSPSTAVNRQASCPSNEIPLVGGFDQPRSHQISANTLRPMNPNTPTCQPSSSSATAAIPPSQLGTATRSSGILEPVSVSELLNHPFTSGYWTADQRNSIFTLSRPKPCIDTLQGVPAYLFYDEIPWLCGCATLRKFFCWPCLLSFYYSVYAETWSVPASLALKYEKFKESREAHEASDVHQEAEKTLKMWLQYVNAPPLPNSDKTRRESNFKMIEKVRRNRKLLSLLVQSVCYLKKEKHDAQVEDYAECFTFIVRSNRELQEILMEFPGGSSTESSTDFVFRYADLVEGSVKKFLKSSISEELKNARFVTLFMEDLSSVVDNSTVAVIAHFVDQAGEIQERVIQLNKIGDDRSAETVFARFQTLVFQLGLRLKLSGFTYSSTLVNPHEITAFNERVERLCPFAKFFHYQGHNLMGLLFGALSHLNRSYRNFFQTMTELQRFFKKHLVATFRHFERVSFSQSNLQLPVTYDFDYGFITTLKQCYSSVLNVFGSILASPEGWDSQIQTQAPTFMSFLQDTTNRFLIALISQLNLAVVDVTVALQGKIDTVMWKLLIRQTIANLITIKNFGFEDIYFTALSPILVKENRAQSCNVPADLVSIFHQTIDTTVGFLHRRFDSSDFGYVDLESVASALPQGDVRRKTGIGSYFSRVHHRPEDVEKFKSQVHLVAAEPMLKDKALAEALKCVHDYNLSLAIPEYSTFLDFAMTIPSSRTSLHCPAVERILSYQRNHSSRLIFHDLIWMEKELLANISRQKNLSEAVIDILTTNGGTKEFSYKNFIEIS